MAVRKPEGLLEEVEPVESVELSEPSELSEPTIQHISIKEAISEPLPKVLYVYDKETVLEAEVLGEGKIQGLNLLVSNVVAQKFSTNISSSSSNREFLNVRRGGGRFDVGTYFTVE